MIKIIYIAGDGRSGSTLLDSVLSNIEGSLSVGECHRFWVRYTENESRCGCNKNIGECELWHEVDTRLKAKFPDYNAAEFGRQVQQIQYYKNFKKIPALLASEAWANFREVVQTFYEIISEISEKKIIIDSSKSMPWAYVLQHLGVFDVRIIHLERKLTAVANSWKKTIQLPEYTEKEVFMPKKGNWLILKTWLKIKKMAGTLKIADNFMFVRYEQLCLEPEKELRPIASFVGEPMDIDDLKAKPNHAIGGNPMRNSLDTLEIRNATSTYRHLTIFEKLFFNAFGGLAKTFWS